MGLGSFNKLPPRPEYVEAVSRVLCDHLEHSIIQISTASKLTKTQVMCVLSMLQDKKKIIVKKKPTRVSLID